MRCISFQDMDFIAKFNALLQSCGDIYWSLLLDKLSILEIAIKEILYIHVGIVVIVLITDLSMVTTTLVGSTKITDVVYTW